MKWKWKNTGNGRSWVPQSHWPLHGMLCVYDEFVMKSLRSHDRENLSFPRTSDNTAKGLHTFKNLLDSLGWYGSVDWAQSCKLKGHLFQFPARHMPGLQARSPVAVTTSNTTISQLFPTCGRRPLQHRTEQVSEQRKVVPFCGWGWWRRSQQPGWRILL